MIPLAGERSVNWRKYTREEYVIWMSAMTGLPVDQELFGSSKGDIDLAYEESQSKPTWVQAAEDVVGAVVDIITVEEEVVEEVVEEIEVLPQDNPFAERNYNSMTVKELQEECRKRDLTIRGTKAEVVLRLNRDDEGIVEQETEDETEAPSEEAAEAELDAPSEESEAVTEEVTDNDNSGETSDINEEE